ncbi:MAG: sugar ABC transporter permease [Anaerolineaceae bacterium]
MAENEPTNLPGESRYLGWVFLAPGLLIYAVFVLYPIFETVRTSFYQWDGFSASRTFVGLENYRTLLQDNQFFLALSHNLFAIFFYSILPIMLGLFLASLIGRAKLPGMTFFRVGLFLPQVISMVVVGVIWRWIFNPVFGPLNVILKAVGLGALTRSWLGDFTWAMPAVGTVGTWVQYGFCMVLFLAGMQRISPDYYEAAQLDGANGWQQFRFITLPALRPEMIVALITTLIAALKIFDLIFVTTKGGPGDQTLVASFLVYRSAFELNRIGYAAAVATVLALVIFAISFFILRFQAEPEE